jgi:hypothetical protein
MCDVMIMEKVEGRMKLVEQLGKKEPMEVKAKEEEVIILIGKGDDDLKSRSNKYLPVFTSGVSETVIEVDPVGAGSEKKEESKEKSTGLGRLISGKEREGE